jgi:hypothetical protein
VKLQEGEGFSGPPDGGAAEGWIWQMENSTGAEISFEAFVQCASP